MPLQITINQGQDTVEQRSVSPETIAQKAREQGALDAGRAVAITIPVIHVVQTALHYETRRDEFRFTTGTLRLNLRHEIWTADNLTPCALQRWLVHENEHVADNRTVMTGMDAAVRAAAVVQPVWITPTWISRTLYRETQQQMQAAIGAIFLSFTQRAVTARDTPAEYALVRSEISRDCK